MRQFYSEYASPLFLEQVVPAGKMDFYLNLLNDKERGPGDQPSIGIILCAAKDDVEVEYALRSRPIPSALRCMSCRRGCPEI